MAKRSKKKPAATDDEPRCAFGNTTDPSTGQAPGYTGPHHCPECYAETERGARGFAQSVADGTHDEEGYTPAERRAQERRSALAAGAAADGAELPPAGEPERLVGVDDGPEHLAFCAEGMCGAGLKYRLTSNGSGLVHLERFGVDFDTVFGISRNRVPICPNGHGEMRLHDEDLAIPVAEAIEKAAAASTAPTQAQLFELAKPFNFEGAWIEIETKQGEIDRLSDAHDADAARAKRSKKELEDAQETLGLMVNRLREQRLKKERDQQAEIDRLEAAAAVARGESRDEFERDRMGETGEANADARHEAEADHDQVGDDQPIVDRVNGDEVHPPNWAIPPTESEGLL